jgi:hypothetical protein
VVAAVAPVKNLRRAEIVAWVLPSGFLIIISLSNHIDMNTK